MESDSYADIHGEKLGPEAVMTYFILYVWDWTHYVTVYQDNFLWPEKSRCYISRQREEGDDM